MENEEHVRCNGGEEDCDEKEDYNNYIRDILDFFSKSGTKKCGWTEMG